MLSYNFSWYKYYRFRYQQSVITLSLDDVMIGYYWIGFYYFDPPFFTNRFWVGKKKSLEL